MKNIRLTVGNKLYVWGWITLFMLTVTALKFLVIVVWTILGSIPGAIALMAAIYVAYRLLRNEIFPRIRYVDSIPEDSDQQ